MAPAPGTHCREASTDAAAVAVLAVTPKCDDMGVAVPLGTVAAAASAAAAVAVVAAAVVAGVVADAACKLKTRLFELSRFRASLPNGLACKASPTGCTGRVSWRYALQANKAALRLAATALVLRVAPEVLG